MRAKILSWPIDYRLCWWMTAQKEDVNAKMTKRNEKDTTARKKEERGNEIKQFFVSSYYM
jgi:hypothetical protein